jgi:tetratricopeptide (TPR) repeat protein
MAERNRHDSQILGVAAEPLIYEGPMGASADLDEAAHLLFADNWQRAERILGNVLRAKPSNAQALHLAGVARHRAGEIKQARRFVEQAIESAPQDARFHITLAQILEEADDLPAAVVAYERAVSLDPLDAETYFALANALKRIGHLDAAVEYYEKALEIVPNDAPTLYNLGNTLKSAARLEEAVEAYRLALSAQPGFLPVYKNLGIALKDLGQTAEGFDVLRTGASLMFAPDALSDEDLLIPLRTSKAKLQHDAEQIEYLIERDKISDRFRDDAKVFDQIRAAAPSARAATESFQLPSVEQRKIARTYNRLIYLNDGRRCEGSALNPKLDTRMIEQNYHASKPEVTYFDDFLTPEALRRLREFCLESTIWYTRYENGYVGAMLGDGFASPLLAQIVDEVPQALPGIFGDHKLNQAWAFKHDSELTGVNLHADFAAVNLNFWITPDDALEDPEAGGLIVWDKDAPLDWDFHKYNVDEDAMRRFLEENDAHEVRIPYRQNRALVFKSDVFHETGRLAFRPGYENRRINVTLSYGYRRSP